LYYWTYSLASPECRNFLSWIVGYANTIGTSTAVASVDWAFAVQVTAAASMGTNQRYAPTLPQTFGVYVAIILLHGLVCTFGTKILARLQTLWVLLNVILCLAIIIVLPITTPAEYRNTAAHVFGNFTNESGWPAGFAFILSFLAPLWTVGGYDSSVHMSEEAANATSAVPWATVWSVISGTFLGWAINIVLAFYMGPSLSAVLDTPIGQPMAQIFYTSIGPTGALALWSTIIVAQFMMGCNVLLVGSRQAFAFSRDGALPFSRFLYRLDKRTKTPVATVWMIVGIAFLLGLLSFAGSAAIGAVFTIVVAANYVAYIIPLATRFVFAGRNGFRPGPFNLGFMSLPVTAVAVTWMVFMIVIFFFPTAPGPDAQDVNYTVVVLGGTMALVVAWYYCPVYGGVHWFRGPIANVGVGTGVGSDAEVNVVEGGGESKDVEAGSTSAVGSLRRAESQRSEKAG